MMPDIYKGPILAPMVRGSIPIMRRLALRYGASCCYTDAVTAQNIVNSAVYKSEKHLLFVKGKSRVLELENAEIQSQRVVVQLAGTDPDVLAQACDKLAKYGIQNVDLNAGCTKEWASQSKMGADLLRNEALLVRIVQRMRKSKIVNLSVKIRLLEKTDDTIHLARALFDAGANAVALHARTMGEDRNLDAPHMDQFALVYEAVREQYLEGGRHWLIYNGSIFSLADKERLEEVCGRKGQQIPVMVARGFLRYPALMH